MKHGAARTATSRGSRSRGSRRIESNHGRYRGAAIADNGDVTPPIIGVPLDGTGGNRTIGDTDGGVLDGDSALDRAVGPMQFIPSTWAKWRSDGNGDGVADPNNIDDAALAAGRYLCAGGRDLATGPGWRAAVLSYNNSDEYGRRVYAAADSYAAAPRPRRVAGCQRSGVTDVECPGSYLHSLDPATLSPPSARAVGADGDVGADLAQGLLVLRARVHRRGHAQLGAGLGQAALALQRAPEGEAGVVVGRVELEHAQEARLGAPELRGRQVGAGGEQVHRRRLRLGREQRGEGFEGVEGPASLEEVLGAAERRHRRHRPGCRQVRRGRAARRTSPPP